MQYIDRIRFIRAFQSMKKARHLSSTKIASRSHLSRTYIYHLSSKKSKSKHITVQTVKKIAKGFGLNDAQTKAWISTMKTTQSTENPYIHQRNQVVKQQHSRAKTNPHSNYYIFHTIRDIMSNKGINTRKLAYRSGLNIHQVNNYINGKFHHIPKIIISKLALGLGVPVQKLLKDNHPHHEPKHIIKSSLPQNSKKRIHVDPNVFKVATRLSRLNDADLAIINMIINRFVNAEKNE